jgi:hypothetical protein
MCHKSGYEFMSEAEAKNPDVYRQKVPSQVSWHNNNTNMILLCQLSEQVVSVVVMMK